MSERSRKPTDGMVEEAERGLAWRREFGRGGTAVGVARARDISNRKELSPSTVARMRSFFARHEVDKKGKGWSPGEDGYPSNGRIAWALWGGDAGKEFADARAVTAAAPQEQPARSTPGELTDAEIEQRRQAGLKSAEARRKKSMADYESTMKGADARKRADVDRFLDTTGENEVKKQRDRLRNPNISKVERADAETALEIALADQRELKIKRAEMRNKLKKELALAERELAYHSRRFDVDKMNEVQQRLDALRKEVEDAQLGDEILKIDKQMQREIEQEAARSAAEQRKAEAAKVAEFTKKANAAKREQEKAAKKEVAAKKKASKKKKAPSKKKAAASKKASTKKKAEPTEVLTTAEKAALLKGLKPAPKSPPYENPLLKKK